jgi:hypothetical protein
MRMTFSHLLHGFVGFTDTVVALWYSADPRSIRISIVLLLVFFLSGVAIVVFQRLTTEKGKRAAKQGQATESQMFQMLEHAIGGDRASIELDVAAPPVTHEETPSPLAELAQQFEKALPELKADPKPEPKIEPKIEHTHIAQSAPNGTNGNGIAHQPPNPARVGTAHVSLPRLSELRGMRFSQALRELDKAKRSAPPIAGPYSLNDTLADRHNDALADSYSDTPDDALNDPLNDPINEALMSAIAPFEAMFTSTASAPEAQNSATAMHESGVAATEDNDEQRPPSPQSFFPTKPSLPAKSMGRREEDSGRSPREPKAPGKETNDFLDQLHILPSRRGQYKKKG